MVEVLVADHPHHRSEDFLLRGGIGVVGKIENGRLPVEAFLEVRRTLAACDDTPAAQYCRPGKVLAAHALAGADHRAELGLRIRGDPDFYIGDGGCHGFEHLGLLVLRNEYPRAQHAALPRVGSADLKPVRRRALGGIGQEDRRRLAAQFEHQPLERRRGLLGDLGADHAGAGERDHVDTAVGGDREAAFEALLDDDIHYPLGQPGFVRCFGEDHR